MQHSLSVYIRRRVISNVERTEIKTGAHQPMFAQIKVNRSVANSRNFRPKSFVSEFSHQLVIEF